MTIRNTSLEYGSVAKLFHWLIFLLIFAMLLVGFLMDDISDKAVKAQVYNLHKLTGITILVLMCLRLLWALSNPKPALPFGTPNWQRVIERITHGFIYLAIILMPIAGWVMSAAAGRPPHFFGWEFNLPVPLNKELKDFAGAAHYWLAIVIIALVSMHILAALYHHFIKRDDVLLKMMP